MMKKLAILMAAGALVSCTPYQQQGALVGGVAGAGLGALFGDDRRDVVRGAAIGAGIGAAGAAAHESSARHRGANSHSAPPPQAPERGNAQPQPRDYPTAQRSTTPGEVLSPYPPHNRIDVSGFRSGQLVKDPQTGEIFRVP